MQRSVDAYNAVDALPDCLPCVTFPDRGPVTLPTGADNPCGAWFAKATVRGAPTGPLAGKTFAVKDNIMVAGLPLMNGCASLYKQHYTPDFDATVVSRLLAAGATIAGKAACEDLCLSGGSHTNARGAVHNPHAAGYSAGGSSSGSAALVALGAVDCALGCDQGGSIRLPSSWCGVVGMKPTHGLVPYTGIMPIEGGCGDVSLCVLITSAML